MSPFGITILLLAGVFIAVKLIKKSNTNKSVERLHALQSQYPNAFRKKFGYIRNIEHLEYDKLTSMASVSETELMSIEAQITEQRIKEKAEIERQKRIQEEKERKERELNAKYNELKEKYPHGTATFENSHPGANTKQDIVKNEETLSKYEDAFEKSNHFQSWSQEHNSFANAARNQVSIIPNWGCYYYNVSLQSVNILGQAARYPFRIWEFFCMSFCRDDSLDYSNCPRVKQNTGRLHEFLENHQYFTMQVYDDVLSFIKLLTGNVMVVFADSGQGESASQLNEYHFQYLRSLLENEGITYVNIHNEAGLLCSSAKNLVVVELITSNENLLSNSRHLLELLKDRKPCLTYIALLKEFSSDEMKTIIEAEAKKIREKEEKERMERERKEAEIERAKQSRARLSDDVRDWETVNRSTLHVSYLLNYYPTTCEFEATEDEWTDRWIVWNFKNTPGKTSETDHEKALSEVIPRLRDRLQSTFGKDLSELTLVCIPASSMVKTQMRYESFSDRLCSVTGMTNGYPYLTVSGERGARHEGEDTSGNITYSIDGDFFNGRNILLFDDVMTRGDSLRAWKSKMENVGAYVIAAMTIGKTTHQRPESDGHEEIIF